MPNANFFTRFGLFVNEGFLDPELCSRIRSEMRSTPGKPATVAEDKDLDNAVDESARKTKSAEVSAPTLSYVKERMLALRPMLEKHFNVTLSGCQEPQFLVYREGDFFRRHADNSAEPDAPEFVKERQVSAVVFLNSEAENSGENSYRGGSLTFYGLMDEPQGKSIGFPLVGEAGLLVAFSPELVHEVTPVTHGERYTVVTWFR
jgi:SM-20-related protein